MTILKERNAGPGTGLGAISSATKGIANNNLSTQNGNGTRRQLSQYSKQTVLISAKQLLLRGAFLRNTDFVIGMVVYTGLDSKIMRNSEQAKVKTSDMETRMNLYILAILAVQLGCSLFSALLGYFWNSNYLDGHWYLHDDSQISSYGALAVLNFFTYFLLYNSMIPISLIVSLEMVKVVQGYFITQDTLMYCAAKDISPKVLTTTINEELGQVEYIFSDKTGTLTCNIMEFNKCVIGNVLYGDSGVANPNLADSQQQLNNQKKRQQEIEQQQLEKQQADAQEQQKNASKGKSKETHKPKSKKEQEPAVFKFYDPHLNGLLAENTHDSLVNLTITSEDGLAALSLITQRDLAIEYWTLLSTAHECIIDKDKHTGYINYQGPSPDEITLVDAARHMGFVFEGSSSDCIDVNMRGVRSKLKFHNSFEFNSDRKRMSVIVSDGDVYKLYVKGADSIIKSRLSKTKPQPFLEVTNDYLTQFSLVGLRTLMMAVRVLSEQEYTLFKKNLTALNDSPDRETQTANLVSELETGLTLIGATAVEDRLQDRVPETIYDLIKAKIKVWMLTGDKLETAENIAKSCRLIQADMHVIQISETNLDSLKENLLVRAMDTFKSLKAANAKKSLLVEGESLRMILLDESLKAAFLKISKDCESVVCCRVTPKQKALVVRLIKESLKKITLAIGDGANDVNMIQEAHIGCGIFGNEGMQAAQSSDFAFGEFKCLWRLVLVHGRWSYIRISEMIIYFFYKNMLFTIPQLYFSFFNAYSGQTIFDAWFITLYNLVFTALPLIARAVLDQDINYKVSVDNVKMGEDDTRLAHIIESKEKYLEKKYPTFYYTSQDKTIFTDANFLSWMLQGIIHGFIIFFVTYLCFDSITFSNAGLSTDLWNLSLISFTTIIFIANLKIAIFTRYWTWLTFVAFGATSFMLYFAFLLASEIIESSEVYLTPLQMFRHSHFYLILFFCVGAILAFDMVVFVSDQFLSKQRILPFMRFLKKQQSTLERRPSWANEMSLFDSFFGRAKGPAGDGSNSSSRKNSCSSSRVGNTAAGGVVGAVKSRAGSIYQAASQNNHVESMPGVLPSAFAGDAAPSGTNYPHSLHNNQILLDFSHSREGGPVPSHEITRNQFTMIEKQGGGNNNSNNNNIFSKAFDSSNVRLSNADNTTHLHSQQHRLQHEERLETEHIPVLAERMDDQPLYSPVPPLSPHQQDYSISLPLSRQHNHKEEDTVRVAPQAARNASGTVTKGTTLFDQKHPQQQQIMPSNNTSHQKQNSNTIINQSQSLQTHSAVNPPSLPSPLPIAPANVQSYSALPAGRNGVSSMPARNLNLLNSGISGGGGGGGGGVGGTSTNYYFSSYNMNASSNININNSNTGLMNNRTDFVQAADQILNKHEQQEQQRGKKQYSEINSPGMGSTGEENIASSNKSFLNQSDGGANLAHKIVQLIPHIDITSRARAEERHVQSVDIEFKKPSEIIKNSKNHSPSPINRGYFQK